jgi:hypothetical protein
MAWRGRLLFLVWNIIFNLSIRSPAQREIFVWIIFQPICPLTGLAIGPERLRVAWFPGLDAGCLNDRRIVFSNAVAAAEVIVVDGHPWTAAEVVDHRMQSDLARGAAVRRIILLAGSV